MDIKRQLEFTLIIVLLAPCLVHAWGPKGHRISAQIAENLLEKPAKTAISELLGAQSLAAASFWADQMRANPSPFWQEEASAYHYVTVPPGMTYAEVGAPGKGDAVTALAQFRLILADSGSSRAHKQMALRFSLHIIQDLHQPLHVGNGSDRGGTRKRVKLLGKTTNLHRVWDTDLILLSKRPEKEWIDRLLAQLSEDSLAQWSNTDPETWIAESASLRDSIYPAQENIEMNYVESQFPVLETRLLQSAVRVAAYFNNLYEK